MSKTPEEQQLKGPLVLLKEAWQTFTSHPTTYIKLMLLTYLVAVVVIFALLLVGIMLYAATQITAISFAIPLVLGIPSFIYLSSWLGVSLTNALLFDSEGVHKNTRETLRESKQFILPFIVTTLLSGIIIVGGYFLFIIPGIVLQIFFSFAIYIILREGKSGMRALLTSREYVRGYGGIVFIYLFLFALITYAIAIVPTIIFDEFDLSFLSSVYSIIVNFISAPLGILFSIGIYKELRRIKGDVTIENYESRKLKYIGLAILGIILPIVFLWFVVTNVLPVFKNLPWSVIQQYIEDDTTVTPDEDFYVYPEAV